MLTLDASDLAAIRAQLGLSVETLGVWVLLLAAADASGAARPNRVIVGGVESGLIVLVPVADRCVVDIIAGAPDAFGDLVERNLCCYRPSDSTLGISVPKSLAKLSSIGTK